MTRMRHGTRSRYNHFKCRCPECRGANTAYQGQYRRRRINMYEGTTPGLCAVCGRPVAEHQVGECLPPGRSLSA